MYKINKKLMIDARLDAGMDVTEVAKKAGLPRMTIVRLENGQTVKPRASTLQKIATVYNRHVTDFIERSDS